MGLLIYTASIKTLIIIMIACILAWTGIDLFLRYRKPDWLKWWKIINAILMIIGLYGIFHFTVLGRCTSDTHIFNFASSYNDEFYREMFMNALLYYPFGLTLSVVIGPWSVLISFLLSFFIELWQYLTGAGLAQGTDVIMNTLGCIIGCLPWLIIFVFLYLLKLKYDLQLF